MKVAQHITSELPVVDTEAHNETVAESNPSTTGQEL